MLDEPNIDILLNRLPEELLEYHVWPHVSPYIKMWLNKNYYNKYHKYLKNYICCNVSKNSYSYDSYVRFIVRNDYVMAFNKLMEDNFDKWFKIKNYEYSAYKFYNYIYFLKHYAIEQYSSKSHNIINNYLINAGYEKKWHKNNSRKNIRWTN